MDTMHNNYPLRSNRIHVNWIKIAGKVAESDLSIRIEKLGC